MTRAVVFLAVSLLAASLAGSAQTNPAQQRAAAQSSAAAQPSSQPATQNQASNPEPAAANDSVRQTATAGTPSDVKQTHGQETPASNLDGQLPQTSTILPLLGLIGLGSLVAGFFARR
jgi:Tfp pilus assembly protein PilV